MSFTHLDADRRPAMVDVGEKPVTLRTATAEARVDFPAAVAAALRDHGLQSAKGPVFDTAIIAGVMGAKRTHDLIPFCHPLAIENCRIGIELVGDAAVIRCTVSVHHKTGVEMEALTGASVAALTIYDMCKALSHGIVIADIRLLAKDGGKRGYAAASPAMSTAPLYGLVLAGGASSRMDRDKAVLEYLGKTQLQRAFDLLSRHTHQVFVSVRASQIADPARAQHPMIIDSIGGEGPIVGIRSALAAYPQVAWLVLACDLPFLSDAALAHLVAARDPAALATAFNSAHDGLPEPLCAIWEPAAAAALDAYQGGAGHCPRKFLIRHPVRLLEPFAAHTLDNINTPQEYAAALEALGRQTPLQLKVQYYALLREQSGRSAEIVQSSASTPADLYAELQTRYGFTLSEQQLKVAVNGEFSDWNRPLAGGDAIVFIPPVAGG